jgi:putative ABC transport system permease protein
MRRSCGQNKLAPRKLKRSNPAKMNILYFLFKDIFRKKMRVLLTICGISIGVCVCIVMLSISESIKRSFKDVYGQRHIDIVVQENDQLSILLSRVDGQLAEGIRKIDGVADAGAILLYIHKLKKAAVPVFGWESGTLLFDSVELVQGRRPVMGKNEVMVGATLAEGLQEGHETQIKIKGKPFAVVGAFKSSSPFEQSAVVMPLADLQAVLHEEGKASFINVKLKPVSRTESATEGVMRQIEGLSPRIEAMHADAFVSEKTKFIVVGEQFSFLVSLITIIAVALGLANTMVSSSFEKRKFLAILVALGWPKTGIALLFVCESMIVALIGGSLGILLGYKGMAYVFHMTSIQVFVPELNAIFVLKIVSMLLASAIAAALVPAWITLNSNPVEVIRSE